MPRNSSGTHTLPTGQPVVSGTVISATTHNALAGDISSELTDSLSRSGKGGMQAPIRTPDGTKTAPAHAFNSETGSGVYRAGAGDVRHAVLGVDALKLTSTGAAVPGTMDVTGAATVGGALGVTGVATFGAAPVLNSGAFVPAGGVTFNATGDQTIAKTGGNLNINVPTGQVLGLQLNGVTKWQMDGTGKFGGDGTNVITGVASPSGSSDAATKGYVDGLPGRVVAASQVTGSASLVAGGFGFSAISRIGGEPVGGYQLTPSTALRNGMAFATIFNVTAGANIVAQVSGGNVLVRTSSAGAPADLAFVVSVIQGA